MLMFITWRRSELLIESLVVVGRDMSNRSQGVIGESATICFELEYCKHQLNDGAGKRLRAMQCRGGPGMMTTGQPGCMEEDNVDVT